MATIINRHPAVIRGETFFLVSALVMAAILVGGFSMQLTAGRSSFGAPWPVHVHGVLFFGWTVLYVLQNALAATGGHAWHRRLGWLATIWVPAMVVMAVSVTVAIIRRGAAPFFFPPLYFMLLDICAIVTFAGLTTAAIVLRRQTHWHRRLMFCGMAMLMGPGFGRLLPMPLLIPWTGWAVFATVIIFPLAGVIRDRRRSGKVHPAWWSGIAAIVLAQAAPEIIAASPAGLAIYDRVTRGTPGAAVPPRAYPPPPTV